MPNGPRKSAYWTVRSAPGGKSNIGESRAPHSKAPRISPRRENSLVARHVCDSPGAALSKSSASDSGSVSHREDRDPVPGPRERDLRLPPGNEQRPLDTGHAPVKGR